MMKKITQKKRNSKRPQQEERWIYSNLQNTAINFQLLAEQVVDHRPTEPYSRKASLESLALLELTRLGFQVTRTCWEAHALASRDIFLKCVFFDSHCYVPVSTHSSVISQDPSNFSLKSNFLFHAGLSTKKNFALTLSPSVINNGSQIPRWTLPLILTLKSGILT